MTTNNNTTNTYKATMFRTCCCSGYLINGEHAIVAYGNPNCDTCAEKWCVFDVVKSIELVCGWDEADDKLRKMGLDPDDEACWYYCDKC